mmetsp:Transcript_10735/g.20935  ORF Transcript_10735/g.20935 Transcript_10735/m.20935 type:complete len:248 (-) Transcript_10735:1021-1764(-)
MSFEIYGSPEAKPMLFALRRATEYLDLQDSLKLLKLNHALSYRLDDSFWRSALALKVMRHISGELLTLEKAQSIMTSIFKRRTSWTFEEAYASLVLAPYIVLKPAVHIKKSAGWSALAGFQFCEFKDSAFALTQNNATTDFSFNFKPRMGCRILVHAAVKATSSVACSLNLLVNVLSPQRATLKTIESYLELAHQPDTWSLLCVSGLLSDQASIIEGKVMLRTSGTTNVTVGMLGARAIKEPSELNF